MLVWFLTTYLFGITLLTKVSSYITCKKNDNEYFRCYDRQNGDAYCCGSNGYGYEQCCYEDKSLAIFIALSVSISIIILACVFFCCCCQANRSQVPTERTSIQESSPAETHGVHSIEEPKLEDVPPAYENVIANDTSLERSSFQPKTSIAETSFSMPPPYLSTYETAMSPASDLNISVSTDLDINVSTDLDISVVTD